MQIRRTCWAAAAGLLLSGLLVFTASVVAVAQAKDGFAPAALLTPPSMNVFRRFAVDRSKMMEFYGGVLALKPMPTLAMPGGGQMTRFQVGTSEIKLTTAAQGSRPTSGGVREVTGQRVFTFFFPDEAALTAPCPASAVPVLSPGLPPRPCRVRARRLGHI